MANKKFSEFTSNTTPLTTDEVVGLQSGVNKRTTLQKVRDLFKTYFDTIYQASLGYTPANKAGDTFTGAISATNLSGTNTGDETTLTIQTKLGTASTSTSGYLTSTDWNTFNGKQASLGFTPENVANKQTDLTSSATKYPTVDAVNTGLATKQATLTDSNFGTFSSGLTAKTTPVDADTINLSDSADSNKSKKLSFTNLKAFLKTYFDTIYQAALGYTAENTANKSSSYTLSSTTTYANTKALVDGLATKQDTITGGATTITSSNLTASRALVSDGSGKVAISSVTSTELGYVSGVTSAIQTQIDSKQNTLTNPITGTGTSGQIAYFNGTTTETSSATLAFTPTSQLLVNNSITASGGIARGTNLTPSLTAAANNNTLVGLDINPTFTNGAFTGLVNAPLRITNNVKMPGDGIGMVSIQGGNGTGAAAFPWVDIRNTDATNNKVQFTIGGGTPFGSQTRTHSFGTDVNGTGVNDFYIYKGSTSSAVLIITANGNTILGNSGITYTDAGYKLDVNGSTRIKGAGNSQATTAFIIQNSSGNQLFKITDDGSTTIGAGNQGLSSDNATFSRYLISNGTVGNVFGTYTSFISSAIVQCDSTTKGFLPPRMTTTQKNAISSPTAGLVVYDTTLNKLCVYTTAWETVTSA